jgi:enamine deaminase RidA (YjgF/YER057c/UK114 family)
LVIGERYRLFSLEPVMNRWARLAAIVTLSCGLPLAAAAQVRHIQTADAGIAAAVWVGDTLYVSGQLPTPTTPANPTTKTPAVYGDTKAQSEGVFRKIEAILKGQELTLADVVMMHVYLAADPALGRADFAGMNAAYNQFFGTATQPNKPARTTIQVAAAIAAGTLVEIEVIAARSK